MPTCRSKAVKPARIEERRRNRRRHLPIRQATQHSLNADPWPPRDELLFRHYGEAKIAIAILCRVYEDAAIYCDSCHTSHIFGGVAFSRQRVTFPPRGLQKRSGVAIFGLVNDMSKSRTTAEHAVEKFFLGDPR
jgi:hypothetical protein